MHFPLEKSHSRKEKLQKRNVSEEVKRKEIANAAEIEQGEKNEKQKKKKT